jgi:hypothetical protein
MRLKIKWLGGWLKCHPGPKKWVRVFLKNLPLKMHFPGNNMMSEEELKTLIEN